MCVCMRVGAWVRVCVYVHLANISKMAQDAPEAGRTGGTQAPTRNTSTRAGAGAPARTRARAYKKKLQMQ